MAPKRKADTPQASSSNISTKKGRKARSRAPTNQEAQIMPADWPEYFQSVRIYSEWLSKSRDKLTINTKLFKVISKSSLEFAVKMMAHVCYGGLQGMQR